MIRRAIIPGIALLLTVVPSERSSSADSFNTNHNFRQGLVVPITNVTDISEEAREQNYRKGLLDFALIRKTNIRSGPPVFPDTLKAFDGKTVQMIGFMNPYDSLETMKHCLIWERQNGCYFCQPPGFLEAVYVHQAVKGDQKLPFIDGPVIVTGKLRLWKNEDDYLFLIEEAKASPYKPTEKKRFRLF